MEILNTAPTLDEKADRLRQILAGSGRLIVAYSGGVDSAFLAFAAHQALGAQMCAVIADSASLARTHLEDALAFAREREIPVEVVGTQELENPAYVRNDAPVSYTHLSRTVNSSSLQWKQRMASLRM